MRVMVAQMNSTVGDLKGNSKKILEAVARARKGGVDAVVFPEMALCGYPPEDLLLHPSFIEAVESALVPIIAKSAGLTLFVGMVRKDPQGKGEKRLLNSVAVIQDGALLGFADKQLLPTYDVFDERRYFEPGKKSALFSCKGKRVGVLICEDMWGHAGAVEETSYFSDPVEALKEQKIDLLINVSASPYQLHKPKVRFAVAAKSAQTLKCPVVFCCTVGANDQLVFDGYSFCVDEKGALCHVAKGFEEEDLLIDLEKLPAAVNFAYDPIENLYKALVLGVRDYLHKSGFKKGCLGLSGGVDSALVACLAVEALGKENVLALLMPSPYSSKGSVPDAQLLADRLGIKTLLIPIDKPFSLFLEMLEPLFEGKAFDTTEENMQARIRALILMAISNKFGHIVLSTGNKSELGMGYCTLYGDMCGGLGVISDVTKKQVYELCAYINRKGEIVPQVILDKAPSAELKPNQKDTDSLPPYDIVDAVVQSYVEQYHAAEQIAKERKIPLPLVEELVRKIHRAEYKRWQAAPGIRVSPKAFRSGRRYPIVQKWVE